ncbi:MAG: nucleotidyltransferase domain-containing protein [Acidimicrobiales bacterium]
MLVFGSFARGDAGVARDLDILAVRPIDVAADDDEWINSLGRREAAARKVVGNALNMLVVSMAREFLRAAQD